MANKSTQKISNNVINTASTPIVFLGVGSYNIMKEKKSQKSQFWTLLNGDYYLLDVHASSYKEYAFHTYKELGEFCKKKFPQSHLTT